MQIIDYIEEQVESLPYQPVTFQHQSFVFDDATQVWRPAQIPNKDFPLILGDIYRVSLSKDLRLKTWHLSLVYFMEHNPETRNVPKIHAVAEHSLLLLLARLEAFDDLVIETPPELSFFFNQTETRLAGANMLVSLTGANTRPPVC